jgi:formate dehydrogenase subunit gamma
MSVAGGARRLRAEAPVEDPPVAHPGRPDLVRRFSGAEITLHWLLVADVTVLTVTGLGLYLGPGSNPVLGHRELVRSLHIDAAIFLILLPLLTAAARPGTLARLWRQAEWFDADDWRWLRRVVIPPFLRRTRALPPQGRLNAGQKLNTLIVVAALSGFTVTGALMYIGGQLPPSLSDAADTWHIWLMFLGAPLVAGHIALAMLLPSTRGSLRGVVTGYVKRSYARRRHARWAATERDTD